MQCSQNSTKRVLKIPPNAVPAPQGNPCYEPMYSTIISTLTFRMYYTVYRAFCQVARYLNLLFLISLTSCESFCIKLCRVFQEVAISEHISKSVV